MIHGAQRSRTRWSSMRKQVLDCPTRLPWTARLPQRIFLAFMLLNFAALAACTVHRNESTNARSAKVAPVIVRTPPGGHGTWPPGPPGVPNMAPYESPLPTFRHTFTTRKNCSKVLVGHVKGQWYHGDRYRIICTAPTKAPKPHVLRSPAGLTAPAVEISLSSLLRNRLLKAVLLP